MKQIQVVNNNGHFDCEMDISAEEWLALLNDESMTNRNVWNTLLKFFYRPNHEASCSDINPDQPSSVNMTITNWATKIKKAYSNRFEVLGTDGHPSYWIVPMTGYIKDKSFIWILRPELVEAIKEKLFQEEVELYKKKLKDPEYWDGKPGEFGEKYKWEAIAHFKEHWNIDAPDFAEMFKEATAKTRNLLHLHKWYPRGLVLTFAKYEPEKIRQMFKELFDESIELKQRVEDFIQKMKALLSDIILHHKQDEPNAFFNQSQNTNAISTYLWLKYPNKYYKYAPKIYSVVNQKFGFKPYGIKPTDGSVDSMLQGFAMYDVIRAKLQKDEELVNLINSLVEESGIKNIDTEFHTATIDFGYFVSRPNLHPNIQPIQENITMFENPYQDIVDLLEYKKNIILQGAPGTGKTYSTAAIALGILGVDVDFNDHKAVMEKYEEYRKEKRRIFFTTFHQSMDYEDFVEGLKPELVKETEQNDNSNSTEKNVGVTYVCKRGIFKEACQAARVGQEFSKWLDDFLNSIIGFENKKEIPTVTGKSKIYVWWNIGNKTISVRPVSSTREPLDRFVAAPNIEKIKSQAANEEDPEDQEPNWPHYSQAIINYVSKEYGKNIQNDNKNNVVLIIDEINRGNVSKIFGELVTLLEKDKRDDNDHPITVTLPYSKEEFSVPSNVYIIGTMNTTDRSTGTLDYAIRRRFAFVTLKADEKVLPENSKARALFNDIKSFIENDKNHPQDMDIDDLMVGHSYFMTEDENELKYKIQYEVIPLLKEYLNDGLLTCSQEDLNKHIKAWIKLDTYKQDSNTTTNSATSESETSQSNE